MLYIRRQSEETHCAEIACRDWRFRAANIMTKGARRKMGYIEKYVANARHNIDATSFPCKAWLKEEMMAREVKADVERETLPSSEKGLNKALLY